MPIVGDVLAERYRIESVLGVGGMASVYRATDTRLDRQVAVKVLAANLAADATFAERFNREAGAMAGINHPNVAAVYDVEPGDPEIGREPFYVMEYCEGGSLADRLKGGGRLPPDELIPIAAAISDGLAELHRTGLVHRDVKPANILFAGDRPKLADFGVAWSEGPRDGDPLTLPGQTVGTLPYLAPELVAGGQPSPASDVYALGVTIFQALTGQLPQSSMDPGDQVEARTAEALPVSAAAPDLGPRFDAALAAALSTDPAARPAPVELAARLLTGLETWGVARPNPGAISAPPAQEDVPTRVALAPPMAVHVEAVPEVAEVAEPTAAEPPSAPPPALVAPAPTAAAKHLRSRSTTGRSRLEGQVIFIAVLAVIAALSVLQLIGGGSGVPAGSAGASASPSASVLPSDAVAALEALGRVDSAIEAARGGKDGLSGKDANELVQLATSVRTAIERGDLGAATAAARELSDRADELLKGLDKQRREALLAAIDDLMAALPED